MAFAGIDNSLGYQQFTCETATGLNLSSSVVKGTPAYYLIKPEVQSVRWRDDGTNPTATVGNPLAVGETLRYDAKNASNLRLIAQTSGAIVNVSAYGKLP